MTKFSAVYRFTFKYPEPVFYADFHKKHVIGQKLYRYHLSSIPNFIKNIMLSVKANHINLAFCLEIMFAVHESVFHILVILWKIIFMPFMNYIQHFAWILAKTKSLVHIQHFDKFIQNVLPAKNYPALSKYLFEKIMLVTHKFYPTFSST